MQNFKAGDSVSCPPVPGQAGYKGRVVSVGTEVLKNAAGQPYVDVLVANPRGAEVSWPSYLLARAG